MPVNLRVLVSAALVVSGIPAAADAAVFATDWQTAGDALITRDTVNGLDWLDLTVTQGLSINQAAAATVAGGAYAGFRVARLDQLFGLYGQAVAPVTPAFNGNTPISDFTPEERTAQRRFVDLIGVTARYDFGQLGVRNDAIGLLRTSAVTGDPALVAGGIFFYFPDDSLSFSWFNDGYAGSRDYSDSVSGVYLVRRFGTAGAVPEPTTWAMLIAGFGLVGAVQRRQQRSVAAG